VHVWGEQVAGTTVHARARPAMNTEKAALSHATACCAATPGYVLLAAASRTMTCRAFVARHGTFSTASWGRHGHAWWHLLLAGECAAPRFVSPP
jgi:hypothetical protein